MSESHHVLEAGHRFGASSRATCEAGTPSLDALRQAVAALPEGSSVTFQRAELLAVLGEGTAPEGPPPDRLLTVKQVADRLGTSAKYVYAHAQAYPFKRPLGKKALRFSEQGLERWLARVR